MNAKSFSIKWAIVDEYKVIRKIHNDAKKSFENAVYSENFQVSEVDWYFPELGRTFFLHKFMEFLKKFKTSKCSLDIRDYLSVLLTLR